MNDITALTQRMKGQTVKAPYYLAECTHCGEMYPSNLLNGGEPLFAGDYNDCLCPHCNTGDSAIADLGAGEETAVAAWNFQQKRIDALVEALEKREELRASANRVVNQQDIELQELRQRIAELVEALEKAQQKVDVYDMLREDYGLCEKGVGLADFVDWQAKRIAELESRTVTVKLPAEYLNADGSVNADMANTCPVVSAYREAHRAAGIQVIEGEG